MDQKQLGVYGELLSARYLKKHGYNILEPNYHSRFGEIDLIARQDDTIVFVEVKTRSDVSYSLPSEAVHFVKQQKIKKTSLLYLSSFSEEVNARYDVIEVVVGRDRKVKIHHIINAFT